MAGAITGLVAGGAWSWYRVESNDFVLDRDGWQLLAMPSGLGALGGLLGALVAGIKQGDPWGGLAAGALGVAISVVGHLVPLAVVAAGYGLAGAGVRLAFNAGGGPDGAIGGILLLAGTAVLAAGAMVYPVVVVGSPLLAARIVWSAELE